MNDRPHTSATKEQEQAVDQAERRGMNRRAEMDIEFLERMGFGEAARELRNAVVVEAKPTVE